MADPVTAAATAFANWVATTVFAAIPTTVGIQTAATIANVAYITAYAAAYVGITATVTMGLSALSRAQMPDPEGQKITRKQTRPMRVYAFGGPSRMSGAYMLRESRGNKLGVVLAICEGRLAGIDRIYLNDTRVTLSGGYVQGQAEERYGTGDLIRLDTRLGLPTETHYGFLTPDFGAFWPTMSRGDGIASLAFLAQHRSRESFARHFPDGELIPSIVGAPVCYDWRDPTQSRSDPATWKTCWNPVIWLVHIEWHRHGQRWDRRIEPVLDALTVEADYCDELITVGSVTEPRYRCAGNIFSNVEPQAIRESILSTMDGWMSVDGLGRLIIKAGRYVEPTFILTADQILGYSWEGNTRDEDAVDELVVSFVSADDDYSEIEAGAYRDEDAIAARGVARSEPLQLLSTPSRTQAMRLARRKFIRLNASRRGSITATIHGLNGLGERYIRLQNDELHSMADVAVEVTNVEVDLANATVTFDVVQADPNIDDDDIAISTPPTIERPAPEPSDQEAARKPIVRSVAYPTSADGETITIVSFNATMADGSVITIPAGEISGLTTLTTYGVFWKEGVGFEAEVSPALGHMTTGSWVFIGWQATSDDSGGYPSTPTPPGGWGGDQQVEAPA